MRCVVADTDSRRWKGLRFGSVHGWFVNLNGDASSGGELRGGDGAGAVEQHGRLGGVEDGGFEADGGGASVEDSVYAAV